MGGGDVKRLPRALALCLLLLASSGSLPGEINGCDTDLSDEVDHVEYCGERCAVLCERLVTCGLFLYSGDPPEGTSLEELCTADCVVEYSCQNPFLCPNEDRYISEDEADTCLDSWSSLSCRHFEDARTAGCGEIFDSCPRPDSCRGENLCDPPEWE